MFKSSSIFFSIISVLFVLHLFADATVLEKSLPQREDRRHLISHEEHFGNMDAEEEETRRVTVSFIFFSSSKQNTCINCLSIFFCNFRQNVQSPEHPFYQAYRSFGFQSE